MFANYFSLNGLCIGGRESFFKFRSREKTSDLRSLGVTIAYS